MPSTTSSDPPVPPPPPRASSPVPIATTTASSAAPRGKGGKLRGTTTNPSTTESSSRLRQPQHNHHHGQASHSGSASLPSNAAAAAASSPSPNLNHQPQSFTDQIAASALSGTYELLKLATGVTLSTTGKLYAPSLQVTRTLLLPSMFAACVDYLTQVTPKRIQDWFRILSSSVYHIIDVLTQETPRGQDFRLQFAQFWVCFVECISSDTSRQVLVDGMSVWVRLAEALNTPEFHALLNQLAITGCRIVDAASSGRNKELVHHAASLFGSACDLLADPKTTCALAEVTAYLCHALEMEQTHMMYQQRSTTTTGAANTTAGSVRLRDRKRRAQQRHQRNAQQRATYDPILINTPNATVEQVILSSLGVIKPNAEDDDDNFRDDDATDDDDDDGSSIPSKVVVCVDEDTSPPPDRADKEKIDEVRNGNDSNAKGGGEQKQQGEWYQRVKEGVRSDVNVAILQEKIMERQTKHRGHRRRRSEPPPAPTEMPHMHASSSKPHQQSPQKMRGAVPSDTFDVEDDHHFGTKKGIANVTSSGKNDNDPRSKQKQTVQLVMDETFGEDTVPGDKDDDDIDTVWPHPDHAERREGETPVEHFHRVLDEILSQKRTSAMKWAISEARANADKPRTTIHNNDPEGRVRKTNTTFRDQIAALRAELEKERQEQQERANKIAQKYGVFVYALLAAIFLAAVAFACFGVYGMRVFFSQSTARGASASPDYYWQGGGATTSSSPELVVRVIREVVHLDGHGNALTGKAFDCSKSESPTVEETDKITSCIANALSG